MGTLTLTPELQAVLSQLTEKTELRDASGNSVGVFTPTAVAEAELYERAKAMIDPAEIARRKQEPGSATYAEIKKRLEALETSG